MIFLCIHTVNHKMSVTIYLNYSDKVDAIVGEATKSIKEQLKKLGCRYNANLKVGKGWIVKPDRYDAVCECLTGNKISHTSVQTPVKLRAEKSLSRSNSQSSSDEKVFPVKKETVSDLFWKLYGALDSHGQDILSTVMEDLGIQVVMDDQAYPSAEFWSLQATFLKRFTTRLGVPPPYEDAYESFPVNRERAERLQELVHQGWGVFSDRKETVFATTFDAIAKLKGETNVWFCAVKDTYSKEDLPEGLYVDE